MHAFEGESNRDPSQPPGLQRLPRNKTPHENAERTKQNPRRTSLPGIPTVFVPALARVRTERSQANSSAARCTRSRVLLRFIGKKKKKRTGAAYPSSDGGETKLSHGSAAKRSGWWWLPVSTRGGEHAGIHFEIRIQTQPTRTRQNRDRAAEKKDHDSQGGLPTIALNLSSIALHLSSIALYLSSLVPPKKPSICRSAGRPALVLRITNIKGQAQTLARRTRREFASAPA
ncbi:hypothetical protein FN846DRAFT_209838 [Sphaerosporella brunnea]|uniref:Uncharacterized protein n=1 Tax=Sphaerosporella brunnea TaxID=1250544 RepID=A0A5J5EPG8_9PEZI|nr:hypothetical protein FN846DRAFT_209838 [Sphaerosporella brunnea]